MFAQEVDVVISCRHALLGDWPTLHCEVRAFREACGQVRLKVILETGELAHTK
jgi:deoxyribose-phosphate aldolase